jgi:GAF domain-containing protein
MSELQTEGDSYDSLLLELRSAIHDARREWSAGLLCAFPERHLFKSVAREVRDELGSLGVEINAIINNQQVTIATSPDSEETSVPADNSLCVLTVGLAKPLRLTDARDGFVDGGHALFDRNLGSWASVPLVVQGEAAGTVCAVERKARDWSDADQAILQRAADRIARAVELWLEEN